MSTSADIEKLDEKLSDDDLVKMISAGRDEESVLKPLKELSRRKSPRRLDIFRKVLGDPKQEASVKKTVITQLGTEYAPENQEVLLRQLDTRDASLLVVTARSLGKIGDERALELLQRTKAPDDATARRALEFAKSLIAYRLRLNLNLIAMPSEAELVKVTDRISFEAKKADAETIRKALDQAKKDVPAIPLAEEGAARLVCRSTEFLLVFNDEFYQVKMLETLRDRSAVPLVLLKDNLSLGRYFLDRYFFTHPSKNPEELIVLGTRPKGELTFAGRIQLLQSGITFKLDSVASRYAPAIEVEGRYHPDKRSWEFTKAVSDTRIAGKSAVGTPRRASPGFR